MSNASVKKRTTKTALAKTWPDTRQGRRAERREGAKLLAKQLYGTAGRWREVV